METAIGAKLKAYSTNSDIMQKGIIHNSDKYAASQKEALTAINDNLKNEIDNANENAKAINAIDTNNILNRSKAYATKYENRRKFVNGLSEEMKKYNVMEYYYGKQQAAADLAYEQE
jgi:hypothetical protein